MHSDDERPIDWPRVSADLSSLVRLRTFRLLQIEGADADDLVQETMLIVTRKVATDPSIASVVDAENDSSRRGYLYRMLLLTAKNFARGRRRYARRVRNETPAESDAFGMTALATAGAPSPDPELSTARAFRAYLAATQPPDSDLRTTIALLESDTSVSETARQSGNSVSTERRIRIARIERLAKAYREFAASGSVGHNDETLDREQASRGRT